VWDTLTLQQRRVYSRFMAAYAGFLQYGDEQIGRLLDALRLEGVYANTIVVLFSDNGPASETKTGGFRVPYGDSTALQQMDEQLEDLGGPATHPLYQRPWAYAGATPLRRYKRTATCYGCGRPKARMLPPLAIATYCRPPAR